MALQEADIQRNRTPITFDEDIFSEKLKVGGDHPTNKKGVFIDTDTGQLYSADLETDPERLAEYLEVAVPYTQDIEALVTSSDGDLACYDLIDLVPSGRVDVLVNGLSVDLGPNKPAYFSGDGGVTARNRGDVQRFDQLYWNGSIAGYELDSDDRVEFDYITSTSANTSPSLVLTVSGGDWGVYTEGEHIVAPTFYAAPPLEDWRDVQDGNNFIKLFVTEGSNELINTSEISVDGVSEVFTILTPLVTDPNDKKIVDGLFKVYNVNGLTITLQRGITWPSYNP